MSSGAADLNKLETKERFDSFLKWSKTAIDREFNTAVWEHINISEVTAIIELLDRIKDSNGTVLDVGCGSGRLLFDLKKRYSKVVGSDFSEGLLRKAKEMRPFGAGLIQSDIERLPFKDGSFDMILCVRVIQHLGPEQQKAAIREMSRVLKRGGRLILMTYNALTALCLYKLINKGPLYKLWPRWPLRDWKWVVDDYSFPWELKKMFRQAALKTVSLRGAVCGEPEMFKFLNISNFLEKKAGFIFLPYLRLCRWIDSAMNRIWPFKFFLGRVLIEGEKDG